MHSKLSFHHILRIFNCVLNNFYISFDQLEGHGNSSICSGFRVKDDRNEEYIHFASNYPNYGKSEINCGVFCFPVTLISL